MTRVQGWWSRRASAGALAAVILLAVLLLGLVALPRFGALHEPANQSSHSYTTASGTVLPGLSVDMREYLHLTEYEGGRADAPSLAPFTYRIAAPWLAGQLPWDAPISLNVVILCVLALGVASLVLAQQRLGANLGPIALMAVLYSFSFPVFYWGSFNYVDGAVVGLLSLLLLLLVLERPWSAVVVLAVALIAKESGVVGLPVILTWVWLGPDVRRRKVVLTSAAVASVLLAVAATRLLAPPARRFYNPWLPSLSQISGYVGSNLGRVGPPAQVFLTGVVVVVLVGFGWVCHQRGTLPIDRRMYAVLNVGVGFGILLNIHAFLAAQWDGRTLWVAYPFALTIGALALSGRRADAPASDVVPGRLVA